MDMARRFGEGTESSDAAHGIVADIKAQKEATRLKAERLVGIIAMSLAVVMLGYSVFVNVTAPAKIEDLDADIVDAKGTLKEKQDFNESGGNIVYVDPVMSSAKDLGNRVCEYQNRLISYDNDWCARQPSTNGPGEFTEPMSTEHQTCLTDFQTECLYHEMDGQLGSGVKGNAMIWSYYGQWEFKADYDYEGMKTQLVFLCFDTADTHVPKRDLLAMAVCEYDRESDKLMNIKVTKTPMYDSKFARDYRRNSNLRSDWGTSSIPNDQAGDPSIGAPNDPNGVTTPPADTPTQTDPPVSQWGTPGDSGGSLVLGGND